MIVINPTNKERASIGFLKGHLYNSRCDRGRRGRCPSIIQPICDRGRGRSPSSIQPICDPQRRCRQRRRSGRGREDKSKVVNVNVRELTLRI